MLALMADHRPCFLFNYLFLQLLPDDIRMVLSGQQWNDPRQLVARADELWLARSPAQPVSGISRPRKGANYGQEQKCSSRNQEKLCFYHKRFGDKVYKCCPPCSYQGNQTAGRR